MKLNEAIHKLNENGYQVINESFLDDEISEQLRNDGFSEEYIKIIHCLVKNYTDCDSNGTYNNKDVGYIGKGWISTRAQGYFAWSKYGLDKNSIAGQLSGLKRFLKKYKIGYMYYWKPTPEEKKKWYPYERMSDLCAWYFDYKMFKKWRY